MNWKFAIATAFLFAIPLANAGGTYSGMVKPLQYSNTLYLDVNATQMSNRPACATRNYVRLIEAQTDEVYKTKFAQILASWLADRPLVLSGNGTCTAEGDEIVFVVSYP